MRSNNEMDTRIPKIRLRAMEPEDIDAIYRWENDPEVWTHSAAHQHFSRNALRQFIAENDGTDIYASRQLRLMADAEDVGTVGCADLFDFDPYHRRAAIGLLTDSHLRGHGYGTAMLLALEAFATEHLDLHLLYCDIATDNIPCIKMFECNGYHHSGTKEQWIRRGQGWVDATTYQKVLC